MIRRVSIWLTLAAGLLLSFAADVRGATYTVTTNDGTLTSGNGCGLREAVIAANQDAGVAFSNDCFSGTTTAPPHTIAFNIAPAGQHTIALTFVLSITKPMVIDGTTQPGYPVGGCASFAVPQIVIDAQGVPANTNGVIGIGFTTVPAQTPNDVTVRGLTVQNMPVSTPGITIGGDGNITGLRNLIECNFVGVNAAGTAIAPAAGNQQVGILIQRGSDNIIRNNLISGFLLNSTYKAIDVVSTTGRLSSRNVISGNRIGTDVTGTAAIANTLGIEFRSASPNLADRGDRNQVLGNLFGANSTGILLDGVTNTRVQANRIGTNLAGTSALSLPNGTGIIVQSNSLGAVVGTDGNGVDDGSEGNLISGSFIGVQLFGATKVAGNLIGTDFTGNAALSNGDGIRISAINDNVIGTDGDGQSDLLERNVISGNTGIGVSVIGLRNRISGNYIGLGANGTAVLPNSTGVGITCTQAAAIADANVVGTNGDGIADAAERNVISGNTNGVLIRGSVPCVGQRIAGNYIGLNAAGTTAVGNNTGVVLDRGGNNNFVGTNADGNGDAAERNVISGNTIGVHIDENWPGLDQAGNHVAGNWIGLDATGGAVIPNGTGVLVNDPVDVSPPDAANVIGSSVLSPLEANVIVGQTSAAVRLMQIGTQSQVVGYNYIGTNATFTLFAANLRGIVLEGPSEARVAGNRIYRNTTGVQIANSASFAANSTDNCVAGNFTGASQHNSPGPSPVFTNNWWGSVIGPNEPITNPGGTGDTVIKDGTSTGITVVPFLVAAPNDCPPALQPAIAKSFLAGSIAVGGTTTLTVTIGNPTDGMATGVSFTDNLPAGLQLAAVPTQTGCGVAPTGVIGGTSFALAGATVASGGTCTVQALVQATSTGTKNNQIIDFASTPAPMSASSNVATLTVVNGLTITKSFTNDPAPAGGTVTLQFVITNLDTNTAIGIGFTDALDSVISGLAPTGLPLANVCGAGSQLSATGNTLVLTDGTLTGGGMCNFSVTLQIPVSTASNTYANTTSAVNGTTFGAAVTGAVATDNLVVGAAASADLSLDKSVNNATPVFGSMVVFTISISNAGPDTAPSVAVKDLLPPGLSYVSDNGGGSYLPGTGIWTVGSLANGASASLQITATASALGTITNYAQVTAAGALDPDSTPNDNSITEDDDDSQDVVVQPVADLSLDKSVNNATPTVGSNVVFTLTLSNAGPHQAPGVVVRDLLPSGLTHVSNNGSGSYNPGTGDWTIASINAGVSFSLQITATVSGTGTITNYVQVTASSAADPDSTPNDSSTNQDDDDSQDLVVGPFADLSLDKSVNNATPALGSNVVFTITVSNGGSDTATGVAVRDLLPVGLTYVSDNGGGAYNSGTGLWTVGSVINGGTASLQITATVSAIGTISNYAQITASNAADPDSTPNDNSVTQDDDDTQDLTVPPAADLSVDKIVNNATPSLGSNVTFSLTILNVGPSMATGVVVRDLLPAGLTYVSDNGGGSYNSGTGVWSVGSVASGATVTLQIVATVTATGTISNYAQITASDQTDPDSTPNDASTTQDDDDTQELAVPATADLSLDKSVNNATSSLGSNVTFTITVSNAGPDTATGVVVRDQLPAGLTYVSDDGGGSYNSGTGVWSAGSVANGASASLQITATVNATGAISNYAQITASGAADSDSAPNDNSLNQDDDDTQDLSVPPAADLSLDKGVSNAAPSLGSNVTFTITVSNAGPDTSTGVVAQDLLPAGLTYISDNGGGSYTPGTGVWNVGTLANGASSSLQITATVNATGTISNYAQVTASGQGDPDSTANDNSTNQDDDDTQDVMVPATADLSLDKSVDNATPLLGSNVTFTLTVSNAGPDTATGIVVQDLLPAGLTYVSDNGGGAYNSGTGLWNAGSLINSGTASLQITATVGGAGTIVNYAQVSGSNAVDPDSTPNDDSTTSDDDDSQNVTALPAADLSLDKSVDNATPSVNAIVNFTITVSNSGPDLATGVRVEDVLPAGLTFLSNNGGNYDPGTGIWIVGSLANGASASLQLTALVTATGTISNYAQITTSDQGDPDSTPNDDSTTADDDDTQDLVAGLTADLSLDKSVSTSTAAFGANVVFTNTVSNAGPNDAGGVTVQDLLPAGLTYVSDTGGGSYVPATGVWTVGSLGAGLSASLQITATVNGIGTIVNYAQVSGSNAADPDSTPNDNSTTSDDDDTESVTVLPTADLSLDKTVDNATPSMGSNVTFTLTVNNGGPDPATGVAVEDILPAGLTFVSSSGGTYSAGTGIWTVGSIAAGGSSSLQITAVVTATGTISNYAQVTASDQVDADSSPNDDSTSDDDDDMQALGVGSSADLSLDVTVDNATPNVGSTVVFTITVSNTGPDGATGVTVRDLLPAGLSYGSDNGGGSYNPATGVWTAGSIASGASVSLMITATVGAPGTISNYAEVTASDQADPDSTPNDGSTTQDDDDTQDLIVATTADLSLDKSVNNATPTVGSTVVFTITVVNSGPQTASGIVVEDQLPSGLAYVSDNGGGSYAAGAGLWTVGSLANGGSASLQITAAVTTAGTIANYAQIVASGASDPDSSPNDDSTTQDDDDVQNLTVPPAADIHVDNLLLGAGPWLPGQSVHFAIVVRNDGPSPATNVQIAETPTNLTITEVSTGCNALPCTIAVLNPAESVHINVMATIDATGPFDNSATALAGEPDPDPADNTANAGAFAGGADLLIGKTLDTPGPYFALQNVQYTLVVTNLGPESATAIQVTDLPTNLTILEVHGACTALPCTIPSLAFPPTHAVTIVVTARINAPGTFDNSATVSSAVPDSRPSNNTDNTGNGGTALAAAGAEAVPTIAEWGALLLSLLLAVAGTVVLRLR